MQDVMGSDEQAEVSMSMGLVCASEFVFVFFLSRFFREREH